MNQCRTDVQEGVENKRNSDPVEFQTCSKTRQLHGSSPSPAAFSAFCLLLLQEEFYSGVLLGGWSSGDDAVNIHSSEENEALTKGKTPSGRNTQRST
eukprot:scaffold8106_cov107-Isochrysis_galbana.AAC.1